MSTPSNNIKVVARFRPQNSLELAQSGKVVIAISEDGQTVSLDPSAAASGNVNGSSGTESGDGFTFDRVFGIDSEQEDVFEYGIRGIVDGK